ncbi:hypothetical protein C2G38_2089062 [Gigaspora rosea]|uniref:Uncharacterized protein n=1 Tax=Gigaspora rosea TaxID=44941 RepID=A0A397V3S2_9GLOM|nr:hypothetical protein C2G38_2089062 [Gigaspora rosea]
MLTVVCQTVNWRFVIMRNCLRFFADCIIFFVYNIYFLRNRINSVYIFFWVTFFV